MWHKALHCINLKNTKIKNFSDFFDDQMQQPNAKEHEDRIQVYPSVVLHCDKHRHEGDAT